MWRTIPADLGRASALRKEIHEYLSSRSDDEVGANDAAVAVSEVLTNAIEHGRGPIWVNVDWAGEHPVVSVRDLGSGFGAATDDTPPPAQATGRGLLIVRRLARSLSVERTGGSSTVVLELALERTRDRDPEIDASARDVVAGSDWFVNDGVRAPSERAGALVPRA